MWALVYYSRTLVARLACLEHQGSLELVRRSRQFPIHLMLKYTPGSNSDGSNSQTQSTVRRAIFHVKTL